MNPKISIVIPTYNRKDFLQRALDSVLKQDYQNLEIIVTDNASADGTDTMMQSYLNDPRIIYIRRPKNIGIARNIKEGFLASTGKYFFCLNDDDYLINDRFFSKAVAIMEENPNISIIRGIVHVHDIANNTITLLPAITNAHQIVKGIDYFCYYLIGEYQPFTYWFTFRRTQSMLDFDAFYMQEADDCFTALGCALLGDVYLMPEVIGYYRKALSGNSYNPALFKGIEDLYIGTEALAIKAKALYPERTQDIDNFFNRFTYAVILYCLELVQERERERESTGEALKLLNSFDTLREKYPNIYYALSSSVKREDSKFFFIKKWLKKLFSIFGLEIRKKVK